MELIQPSVTMLPQTSTLEEILQRVEQVARISYGSEDKIEEKSYIPFCKMLLRRGHLSPFEQGTIYMIIDNPTIAKIFIDNPYSKTEVSRRKSDDAIVWYVTTNLRVLRDIGAFHDDLQVDPIGKIVPYDSWFYKRVTFKIVTSIDISREFNRHRANSINEASTRYIDNSNVKICTSELMYSGTLHNLLYNNTMEDTIEGWYLLANGIAELCYQKMLELGASRQLARKVLTLGTTTTMYHTAFIDDWIYFLDLRLADAAHPDIRVLAESIKSCLESSIKKIEVK